MKRLLVYTLLFFAASAIAQERSYVIKGVMNSTAMCYSNDTVKEVRLERIVDGQPVVIATSPVVDNRFVFEGTAPEIVELCNITGFDNGTLQLFLEEGEITVWPFDAAYPVAARIGGQRPVVVLAGAVYAGERLFVEQAHQIMLGGALFHHHHNQLVGVAGVTGIGVYRCKLVLAGCALIMLGLG